MHIYLLAVRYTISYTDACIGSLHLVSEFCLGLLIWGGVVQVCYIMCTYDAQCMHCVGIISGVFSFLLYIDKKKRLSCFYFITTVYAPCGHISSLFSIFFLSYFFPKRHYNSHIINNHMTDFFHHHSIMYVFIPPIFSCLLHILLLFVRTISP